MNNYIEENQGNCSIPEGELFVTEGKLFIPDGELFISERGIVHLWRGIVHFWKELFISEGEWFVSEGELFSISEGELLISEGELFIYLWRRNIHFWRGIVHPRRSPGTWQFIFLQDVSFIIGVYITFHPPFLVPHQQSLPRCLVSCEWESTGIPHCANTNSWYFHPPVPHIHTTTRRRNMCSGPLKQHAWLIKLIDGLHCTNCPLQKCFVCVSWLQEHGHWVCLQLSMYVMQCDVCVTSRGGTFVLNRIVIHFVCAHINGGLQYRAV